MMTESQRRRLTEFLGKCWHDHGGWSAFGVDKSGTGDPSLSTYRCIKCNRYFQPKDNPSFTTWNEVMPLLKRLVEVGEWEAFYVYCKNWLAKHPVLSRPEDIAKWIMGDFTNPKHTAALVADYLEGRDGLNDRIV